MIVLPDPIHGLHQSHNYIEPDGLSLGSRRNGVFVNAFENVIPPGNASYSVKVYLVTNGKDIPINPTYPVYEWRVVGDKYCNRCKTYITGATHKCRSISYLNIKVVIE